MPLPDDTALGIIDLALDDGSHEYWLAFPNFYSVMTYNPRIYYAMAVTQLAQRIEAATTPAPRAWPAHWRWPPRRCPVSRHYHRRSDERRVGQVGLSTVRPEGA